MIELALGRFPFAEDDGGDSDFDDFADLQDTLSPSNTREGLPPPRSRPKKDAAASKKDKRKSKGVSLQGGGMTMSILELLQHIVNEPAPRLTPVGAYPKEAEDFLDACLLKDPERRPTPKELLVREASSPTQAITDRSLSPEIRLDFESGQVKCRFGGLGGHYLRGYCRTVAAFRLLDCARITLLAFVCHSNSHARMSLYSTIVHLGPYDAVSRLLELLLPFHLSAATDLRLQHC